MKMVFKQAFRFDRNGKSFQFGLGVNEVPEELNDHPFFHKMIEAGLIQDADESKMISPDTLVERQKKLVDKMMAPKAPPVVKPDDEAPAKEESKEEPPVELPEHHEDEVLELDEDPAKDDVGDDGEQKAPKKSKLKSKR